MTTERSEKITKFGNLELKTRHEMNYFQRTDHKYICCMINKLWCQFKAIYIFLTQFLGTVVRVNFWNNFRIFLSSCMIWKALNTEACVVLVTKLFNLQWFHSRNTKDTNNSFQFNADSDFLSSRESQTEKGKCVVMEKHWLEIKFKFETLSV